MTQLQQALQRVLTPTVTTDFMLQRFRPLTLRVGWRQRIAGMLAKPSAPPLLGQCCDRLRPTPVLRELESALRYRSNGLVTLVDWRWNSQLGCAEGLIWHHDELQSFRWWRATDRVERRSQLRCRAADP